MAHTRNDKFLPVDARSIVVLVVAVPAASTLQAYSPITVIPKSSIA